MLALVESSYIKNTSCTDFADKRVSVLASAGLSSARAFHDHHLRHQQLQLRAVHLRSGGQRAGTNRGLRRDHRRRRRVDRRHRRPAEESVRAPSLDPNRLEGKPRPTVVLQRRVPALLGRHRVLSRCRRHLRTGLPRTNARGLSARAWIRLRLLRTARFRPPRARAEVRRAIRTSATRSS